MPAEPRTVEKLFSIMISFFFLFYFFLSFVRINLASVIVHYRPLMVHCLVRGWTCRFFLWFYYHSFWIIESHKGPKLKCIIIIQNMLKQEGWRMWISKLNTNPHVCTLRLVSTSAPPSSHQLFCTGHMRTVNTKAPLHPLAFCLYFLRQNNGYKRQSGKNKIWCKAQILVPEDWVNWPSGLVKKPTQERRRALLLAHLSSTHVPMF